MSNLGNMVTNLICDASQYTRGTDLARSGNRALSGSIDGIIGQLERQKRAMANATATTQGNILKTAGKGAGEGSINYALQLNSEVEAMKRVKAEQEALNAAKERSKQVGNNLVSQLQLEKATYGMTAAQIQIYKATQAGASAEDIRRATVLQNEIAALRAAKEAQESLNQQTNIATANTGGLARSSLMVTEVIRGTEDAVAGFTNNGLKGMLQATTNNVTQLGSLMKGNGGLYLQIGAIAALIGVSLIPKIYDWVMATEEVTKKKAELAEASKRAYEQEVAQIIKLQNLRHDDIVDQQKLNKKASEFKTSDDAKQEFDRIDQQRQELDKQREAAKREQFELKKPVPQNILSNMSEDEKSNLKKDREAKRRAAQEAEADAIRESEKLFNHQRQLQKQIAEMKIIEGKRAASEEWIAEQKLLGERRNEDKKADEEKHARRKNFASELAGVLQGNIDAGDPNAKSNQENERKKRLFEEAEKRGLMTTEQKDRLSKSLDKEKPVIEPNSQAAVVAGSKEAYSSVVRAMREAPYQTKLEQYNKEMADTAKESKAILEKLADLLGTGGNTILENF